MFDPFSGHRRYAGQNPPAGATITYYLKTAAPDDVRVEILNADGTVLRELRGGKNAGFNTVVWDLRGNRGGAQAASGSYGVRVSVGDKRDVTIVSVADWVR
jgi:hypothetical protein